MASDEEITRIGKLWRVFAYVFNICRICADVSKKETKKEDRINPPLGWSLPGKARVDIQSCLREKPVDLADGELSSAPCLVDNKQAAATVLG